MPMYEFKCTNAECQQQFEELKNVGDYDANCPVCSSKAEKIVSATSFVVEGSTNRSIDTVIGADAERRWSSIEDNKKQRIKQHGNLSDNELKVKEQQRVSSVLQRQQGAFSVIDKAKKDAGVTKRDEISHLLNSK
jgi:putative FmdB family regulatory protein